MSFHEIIVAEEGTQTRVTIAPAMPLDAISRTFDDRNMAMAFACLVSLERGIKIVTMAGRARL